MLSYFLGDTTLCATNLFEFAGSHSGHLGQYGSSCYVVVTQPDHWATAERTCLSYGGHLVSVNDQPEQDYLVSFLGKNYNHHSAWIGLNDGAREGQFEWTSGTDDMDLLSIVDSPQNCVKSYDVGLLTLET